MTYRKAESYDIAYYELFDKVLAEGEVTVYCDSIPQAHAHRKKLYNFRAALMKGAGRGEVYDSNLAARSASIIMRVEWDESQENCKPRVILTTKDPLVDDINRTLYGDAVDPTPRSGQNEQPTTPEGDQNEQ